MVLDLDPAFAESLQSREATVAVTFLDASPGLVFSMRAGDGERSVTGKGTGRWVRAEMAVPEFEGRILTVTAAGTPVVLHMVEVVR